MTIRDCSRCSLPSEATVTLAFLYWHPQLSCFTVSKHQIYVYSTGSQQCGSVFNGFEYAASSSRGRGRSRSRSADDRIWSGTMSSRMCRFCCKFRYAPSCIHGPCSNSAVCSRQQRLTSDSNLDQLRGVSLHGGSSLCKGGAPGFPLLIDVFSIHLFSTRFFLKILRHAFQAVHRASCQSQGRHQGPQDWYHQEVPRYQGAFPSLVAPTYTDRSFRKKNLQKQHCSRLLRLLGRNLILISRSSRYVLARVHG